MSRTDCCSVRFGLHEYVSVQRPIALDLTICHPAPPFLAFYGLVQNNETLLQMAYDQCRLYRDELITDEYLWAHVRLGSWQDEGAWATGNAWAAMGIMRVYATIEKSSFRESMSAQLVELGNWAAQITQQSWRYRSPITGGLYNYLGSDSTSQFVDLAATALMAAATYRVSQYGIDDSMVGFLLLPRASY